MLLYTCYFTRDYLILGDGLTMQYSVTCHRAVPKVCKQDDRHGTQS